MVEAAQILIYDVTEPDFLMTTRMPTSWPVRCESRTGSCLMIAFGTVYTLGQYSFGELRGAMQKSRDS
jgi:hypothetical protein